MEIQGQRFHKLHFWKQNLYKNKMVGLAGEQCTGLWLQQNFAQSCGERAMKLRCPCRCPALKEEGQICMPYGDHDDRYLGRGWDLEWDTFLQLKASPWRELSCGWREPTALGSRKMTGRSFRTESIAQWKSTSFICAKALGSISRTAKEEEKRNNEKIIASSAESREALVFIMSSGVPTFFVKPFNPAL